MIAKNKTLNDIIALVGRIAPSRSCKNPILKFYAEISETLETLGPKLQNAHNCSLRLVGGTLKEAIHTYALFSPNIQVPSVENSQKGRSYGFSGNPRRVVRFLQER
jgi:hypothetical protein